MTIPRVRHEKYNKMLIPSKNYTMFDMYTKNIIKCCLPPKNIINIVKIFSPFVLAETFPKPTLVKLLSVKYNAVKYFVCKHGPLSGTESLYGEPVAFPSCVSQLSSFSSLGLSKLPIAYQTQANQWATNAKPNINSKSNAAPYSE